MEGQAQALLPFHSMQGGLRSPPNSEAPDPPLSCEERPATCGAHKSGPGEFCAMQASSRSKQSLRCPRLAPRPPPGSHHPAACLLLSLRWTDSHSLPPQDCEMQWGLLSHGGPSRCCETFHGTTVLSVCPTVLMGMPAAPSPADLKVLL